MLPHFSSLKIRDDQKKLPRTSVRGSQAIEKVGFCLCCQRRLGQPFDSIEPLLEPSSRIDMKVIPYSRA